MFDNYDDALQEVRKLGYKGVVTDMSELGTRFVWTEQNTTYAMIYKTKGVWKIETGDTFTCSRCGVLYSRIDNKFVTGYATDKDDKLVCYTCCGVEDRQFMKDNGRITLYLVRRPDDVMLPNHGWVVTNWPGTLTFPVEALWKGRHNWGLKVMFARFIGPDGFVWSGKCIGDNTELFHCRRTKIHVDKIKY